MHHRHPKVEGVTSWLLVKVSPRNHGGSVLFFDYNVQISTVIWLDRCFGSFDKTSVLIGQIALGMEVIRMFTVIDQQELTNREKPVLLYAKDLKVDVWIARLLLIGQSVVSQMQGAFQLAFEITTAICLCIDMNFVHVYNMELFNYRVICFLIFIMFYLKYKGVHK